MHRTLNSIKDRGRIANENFYAYQEPTVFWFDGASDIAGKTLIQCGFVLMQILVRGKFQSLIASAE